MAVELDIDVYGSYPQVIATVQGILQMEATPLSDQTIGFDVGGGLFVYVSDVPEDGNVGVLATSTSKRAAERAARQLFNGLREMTPWRIDLYDADAELVDSRPELVSN